MHFLQLLHLTVLSQFKFNSPKKSQYLLYSFNQEPLATTILLRFKFNQYKDHNILVHLGYHLQIPFVTTDPFSIQIRSTKRWQYPRPLPAISMKSSRFPWSNQPEFTPFSRATPKKRNWKRSHLNDKGTIHFCWTAYFLAPVYANGKYTGTSSIPIVSRCKFLLPPLPWTGGDYKKSRNTRFHLPSRHSSVHSSERASVCVCVCVCV